MTNSPDEALRNNEHSAGTTASAPERKPIQTFALHACFLTLLFWVMPAFDAAYAFGFKSTGNALFGQLGSNLLVEYRWIPPGERDSMGEMEMVGRVIGVDRLAWESRYEVRNRGYAPSAMLLALMLATPMSRKRRVFGSVAGLIALNLFFVGQTGLLATTAFAAANASLVPAGESLASSVEIVKQFTGQPIPRYAAVFATWALLAAPARGLDLGPVNQSMRNLFGRTGGGAQN